jgi:uncharacterized protein YegL
LASQAIAGEVNLNVVVVLDDSGSMDEKFSANRSIRKIEAARQALTEVINGLPNNAKLGIITFHGWAYPLGPLDKAKVKDAVQAIRPGGGTPLGEYMKHGADALLALRDKQKYGTYKLVIITDGESGDNVTTPLVGSYGILSKGLQAEAIGVDMSTSHTLAIKIPYRSAASLEELKNAVAATLAESPGSGDSTDYDLIAPLEPRTAAAALEALSTVDNAPVGTRAKLNENGQVQYDSNGQIIAEKVEASTSLSRVIGIVLGIVLAVLFVIFVIIKITRV